MAEYMAFDKVLEEDDYGIIVGRDGSLKGIWVPQHLEDEDELPESITKIVKCAFGINPNEPITLH